jgi:Putative transposase/Transposase zinc-binding domain
MRCREPLKQILIDTRDHWDHPGTRPAVRENFSRMINCRTAALGAEIFASTHEEKLVYHTCKSRACPSCGRRATLLWQREQWAALPDIRYAGIALTMPDVLWAIFQKNRHLLHDLPALGAAVIQQWAKIKFGVSVLIMVIPHTFGARLNFNSHLHILVSAGGLNDSGGGWTDRLYFDRNKLMHMWRFAVISFLRDALKAGVLISDLPPSNLKAVLAREYRWWSTHVDYFQSKEHFLRYAGRYARRPPIAQHRFEEITDATVRFSLKDKRLKRRVSHECSPAEFVALLAEHVPDRYRHAVRYFGLLAPRSKRQTATGIFLMLGQQRRPRPRRLGWAYSVRRDFGSDPLIDSRGQRMHWVGRLSPEPIQMFSST